ncbi:hypothetical protein BY458DRAFT_557391 [Sporodiniella umbellata]|nr:hypothetical protein BY458DRAFT_557391 [Sporodiniella umbellata]
MFIQLNTDTKVEEYHDPSLELSDTGCIFMRKRIKEMINVLSLQLTETPKKKRHRVIDQPANSTAKSLMEYTTCMEAKKYHPPLGLKTHGVPRKRIRAATPRYHQNEHVLQSNIQRLEVENRKLSQKMRLHMSRANQQITKQERKIQQLQNQQAQFYQTKKKLEKKYQEQRVILRKRNKEAKSDTAQLKELISMMKKAVLEGGVLDEKMLVKLAPILGGNFAVIAYGGGHGFPKKKNPIPASVRIDHKKQQLNQAISQYVEGKHTLAKMESLLIRRRDLTIEKMKLDEVSLETEQNSLLSNEIQNISIQIQNLQTEAAHKSSKEEDLVLFSRTKKSVRFVDQIINEKGRSSASSFETQCKLPTNAAPEVAYDFTCKLVRTLETDEYQGIVDHLIENLIDSRTLHHEQQSAFKAMEENVALLTCRPSYSKEQEIVRWVSGSEDVYAKSSTLIGLPDTPIASPPSPRERNPETCLPDTLSQQSEEYLSDSDSYASLTHIDPLKTSVAERTAFNVFDRLAQTSTRSSRAKMSNF